MSHEDIDELVFPGYFTASFDYRATGEGRTVGIFMGFCTSADELRSELTQKFGSYFTTGAKIWQGLQVPAEIEHFISEAVKSKCAEAQKGEVGNFAYFSIFHLNRS